MIHLILWFEDSLMGEARSGGAKFVQISRQKLCFVILKIECVWEGQPRNNGFQEGIKIWVVKWEVVNVGLVHAQMDLVQVSSFL